MPKVVGIATMTLAIVIIMIMSYPMGIIISSHRRLCLSQLSAAICIIMVGKTLAQ